MHLFESEDTKRLQELISGEWMQARYQGGHHTYAGFLEDVDLAWRAMVEQGAEEAGTVLALVRLQMARQVVEQEANIYTCDILKTLVWLGRDEEALAHVRSRKSLQTKFYALLDVFEALREKGRPEPSILEEVWSIARAEANRLERARMLCVVAATCVRSDDARAGAVFEEAKAAVSSITDTENRAEAAATYAITLGEALRFDEAKEAAR